jgi:hypothetical protein
MPDGPHSIDLRAAIARLAALDVIAYVQVRNREAEILGVNLPDLNAMVKEAKRDLKATEAEATKKAEGAKKPAEVNDQEKADILARLAAMDAIGYAQERTKQAERLRVGVTDLDAAVKQERKRLAEEAEKAKAAKGPDLIKRASTIARLSAIDALSYARELPIEAANLGVTVKDLNKAVRDEQRQAAQRQVAEAVAAMVGDFNKRYTVVLEGGKAVVYLTTYDPTLGRERITTMAFEDLKKLYLNQSILTGQDGTGKQVFKSVADVWLTSQDRAQYIHGVVFDPTGRQQDGILNLWKGFAVKPEPGNWSIMKDHIRIHICAENAEHFDYFMGWLARLVQFPAEQAEVAIVMRSVEGTGKGTVARALMRIFGRHAMTVSNSKHLVGAFNWHLRDCVFLFADEAFFAGDRAHVGVLNSLITEPTLTLEGKGKDIGDPTPNRLHIMMASNESWVVPATVEARRYFVLDVLDAVVGNKVYFDELNAQMEDGGHGAMLYDLLNCDLTGFDYRNAPKTAALQGQKKLSMDTTNAWWSDVLHRGYVYQSRHGWQDYFGQWHEEVSTDVLYDSYSQFAQGRRERHPLSRETVGREMRKFGAKWMRLTDAVVGEQITDVETEDGRSTRKGVLVRRARPSGFHLGALTDARNAFTEATKLPAEWEPDEG